MSYVFNFIARLFGRSAAPEAQPEVPAFMLAIEQCNIFLNAVEQAQEKNKSNKEPR